jgi:hypothetical protein
MSLNFSVPLTLRNTGSDAKVERAVLQDFPERT